MNSPLCQTTSQMRGVLTSFMLPSFEYMLFTPLGNTEIKGAGPYLYCTVRCHKLESSFLITCAERVQTGHNTVVPSRLARTLACCNYGRVNAKLSHINLEIINTWALPKNRSKITLIFLLLATFPVACTNK